MDLKELKRIVAAGESDTVEFKKSTAQLPRPGETLCAFLNGAGGWVLIGVTPEGRAVGQTVADTTLRELAALLDRLEPAAPVRVHRLPTGKGTEVIVLEAPAAYDVRPFAFRGRPYQRVATVTSVMPQERYQSLLLDRAHTRNRWENEVAGDLGLDDLDREETCERSASGSRPAGCRSPAAVTSARSSIAFNSARTAGCFNAAIVLFGTRLEQDYPQCQIRLARFRGIDKSAFVDNRQIHGHAFRLLDEAMAFMLRHLPIAGRFEPGRLERIDEPLFPVAALREAVINAICHRTYAHAGLR